MKYSNNQGKNPFTNYKEQFVIKAPYSSIESNYEVTLTWKPIVANKTKIIIINNKTNEVLKLTANVNYKHIQHKLNRLFYRHLEATKEYNENFAQRIKRVENLLKKQP